MNLGFLKAEKVMLVSLGQILAKIFTGSIGINLCSILDISVKIPIAYMYMLYNVTILVQDLQNYFNI